MSEFDTGCRRCARLATFLDEIKLKHPDYHAAPVAPFGDPSAGLLIVGLAPGLHGANRTGRPFTGDYAGILLYQTLYKYGFASKPESESREDNLELINCRITNAVKCLPPENKPSTAEVAQCNRFLTAELSGLKTGSVVLALGGIAHKAVLRAVSEKQSAYAFAHASEYPLDAGFTLLSSYHCSRYNTQTRRLTTEMFEAVVERAGQLLTNG